MSAPSRQAPAQNSSGPTILVVSGTGTDIGKSVVTAAVAAAAREAGMRVGIAKPIQTGLGPSSEGDSEFAARLAGVDSSFEYRRLVEALAPETAVRRAESHQSTTAELVDSVREWIARENHGGDEGDGTRDPLDLVLVEGAGGLLVRLGTDVTVLDLAREFGAEVLLVTRSGLGTLSDTELATREIAAAGLRCAGLVIGSWPTRPDLAERCNLEDLPRLTGQPLLGSVPENAGVLEPEEFANRAPGWFEPGVVENLRNPSY